MAGISLLLCGLSPDITVLLIAITIGGVATSGFETLIYVYTSEVSGGRFRNFSVVTLGFVWAVAQVLTSPLFYIISEWRAIFIGVIAIPFLISLIPTYFFIFETPRYLVSKKQFFAARDVIKRMCVVNLRPIFQPRLLNELEDLNNRVTLIYAPRHSNETKSQGSKGYIDLFTEPELRRVTFLLLYIWFFRNITYFGLNYSLPVLGEAIYTNFTVAAFSEAFANLVAAPLKLKYGRVKLLNLSSVFVTISCLMMIFFPIPKDCYDEESECYQKFFAVAFSVVRFIFVI
jgi:MFS transporter, OCT family, solute carrier family 22 (organic cation transporter), member 1